MNTKQTIGSLIFPVLTIVGAAYCYIWESLMNGDWSVRYAFRGAYIAFAVMELVVIILTLAFQIDTAQYLPARIAIFCAAAAFIAILIIISGFNESFGVYAVGLILLALVASVIVQQTVVFKKYCSFAEWMVCLFSDPFVGILACVMLTLVEVNGLAGIGYYAIL